MIRNMLVAAVAACSSSAFALTEGVLLDGVADPAYGSALVVQDNQTQFGDSNIGVIDFANGSELDVGYGFIDVNAGLLRLVLAGNLESNFNKLEIFIDYRKGGQNTLRGDNPDVDFNGLNRMGDDGSGNGLTFDAGFAADYYIMLTGGNSPYQTFANSSQLLTRGGGTGSFLGSGGAGTNALLGSNGINIAIDNSNTLGVDGGAGPASGAGVTTGIELEIPLSLLEGYADGAIRVCAFINGGGHDFLANQVLGGLGGSSGNLGEPRSVNFATIGGDQFFTVASPKVEGDLDGDGLVGPADLAMLLGAWGTKGPGDLDGDGVVGPSDLAILLGAWG